MTRNCLTLIIASLFVGSQLSAAAPTLTSVYPPGIQQGTTSTIKMSGSWTSWPVKIDGEFPEGLTVKTHEDAGVLEVTVAVNLPSGPYYFRIYDAEGASPLIPIIVGAVNEIQEEEPNAKPGEWKTIELPTVVNGQLKESGDVDIFGLNLKAGEKVTLMVTANNILGSPMDGILQVADERGFVVAQNDDERNIDPQLSFIAAKDGVYQVRLFAFPTTPNSSIGFSAAATYIYRITASKDKFLDYCLPLVKSAEMTTVKPMGIGFSDEQLDVGVALNGHLSVVGIPGSVAINDFDGAVAVLTAKNAEAAVTEVSVPVSLSGVLKTKAEEHMVLLKNQTKDSSLSIKAYARTIGFPTDPIIQIKDAAGVVLFTQDDLSRTERDPEFSYKIPADGDYQLTIRDLHRQGGERYAYRVDVQPTTAAVKMSVDRGELLKKNENLLIPLTVERTGGFNKEMLVEVKGLPEGMTAIAAKSEASGDSAKKVQVVLKGEPQEFSGPVTIVGSYEGGSIEAHYLVKNSALTRNRFWLTVLPAAAE